MPHNNANDVLDDSKILVTSSYPMPNNYGNWGQDLAGAEAPDVRKLNSCFTASVSLNSGTWCLLHAEEIFLAGRK